MKKFFYLMIAVVCLGFAACGSDDDGGNKGDSVAKSMLVGEWVTNNGTIDILFSSNGTGEIYRTSNANKFPVGKFSYSDPYEVEKDGDEIGALIKVTFTSGENSGQTIEWEYYGIPGSKTLNIEGNSFKVK